MSKPPHPEPDIFTVVSELFTLDRTGDDVSDRDVGPRGGRDTAPGFDRPSARVTERDAGREPERVTRRGGSESASDTVGPVFAARPANLGLIGAYTAGGTLLLT